jgi:hypothetical protein
VCAERVVCAPIAPSLSLSLSLSRFKPTWVAVRHRLPSGVHAAALTEQRALLTDMWTNLVAAVAAGVAA